MWLFADFGLLMPVTVPMDKADPRFTEGKFNFQVRGRIDSHLRYFMDNYMEPGSFHDEIQYTPHMDYNVRFYTTQEAFAEGIKNVALAIDYKNFKASAERIDPETGFMKYQYGKRYHKVLNTIWAVVGSAIDGLAPAGGSWGPYSAENPNGYGKSRKAKRGHGGFVGSSFFDNDDDWEYFRDTPAVLFEDDMDYTPDKMERVEAILDALEYIPADQWEDYCTESEWALIAPIAEAELETQRQLEEARQKLNHKGKNRKKKNRRTQRRNGRQSMYR